MKRYPLTHTMNTRDLGGYPLAGGGETRYGRMLRSDAPVAVSPQDEDLLLTLGVTTIIDLRHEEEIRRNPCALMGRPGFHYHNVPFHLGCDTLSSASQVGGSYFRMAEELSQAVAQVFRTMAAAPGGVLYHCTAGKDRTGVVSALLLDLAGVDRADIVANYQVSYTYLEDFIRQVCIENPDMPAFVGRSDPAYMKDFLDLLAQTYGNARGYLRRAGVSEEELSAVLEKLTK
jgi:protein-tyrosine phosphatase